MCIPRYLAHEVFTTRPFVQGMWNRMLQVKGPWIKYTEDAFLKVPCDVELADNMR